MPNTEEKQLEISILEILNINTIIQGVQISCKIYKKKGQPANFKMSVLKSYSDSLSRQAAEGVYISKMQGEILNGRSEFYQPSIVSIRREVTRGL